MKPNCGVMRNKQHGVCATGIFLPKCKYALWKVLQAEAYLVSSLKLWASLPRGSPPKR